MPTIDIAALEAALPAAVIAAVANEGGLTEAAQVFVNRSPRRDQARDPQVFILSQGVEPEPSPLGALRTGFVYRLTFEGSKATRPQQQRWTELLRRAFHDLKNPAGISGLRYVEVRETIPDVHQQQGPALAGSVTLVFHGEE